MQKIAIVYWSGTGNTEQMAEAVAAGAKTAETEVSLTEVGKAAQADLLQADAIALGCPAMGAEVLEEDEMEPFVQSLEPGIAGKRLALFGSYDWGDGQWMRDWEERMKGCGATLVDSGLIVHGTPDEDGLSQCRELGRKLAAV
jgi:flavodoxin I